MVSAHAGCSLFENTKLRPKQQIYDVIDLKCDKKATACYIKDTQCPIWTTEEFATSMNEYID